MVLQKKELVLGCSNRNETLEIRGNCIAAINMAEALAGK